MTFSELGVQTMGLGEMVLKGKEHSLLYLFIYLFIYFILLTGPGLSYVRSSSPIRDQTRCPALGTTGPPGSPSFVNFKYSIGVNELHLSKKYT